MPVSFLKLDFFFLGDCLKNTTCLSIVRNDYSNNQRKSNIMGNISKCKYIKWERDTRHKGSVGGERVCETREKALEIEAKGSYKIK